MDLYKKFQKPLVSFANTPMGRWYFELGQKEYKDKRVVGVDKNGVFFHEKRDTYHVKIPFGHNFYDRKIHGALKIGAAISSMFSGNPIALAMGETFNFDAAGDGYVGHDNGTTVWATVRDATDGTGNDETTTTMNVPNATKSGAAYLVYRAFYPSTTSSLGAGATILAATANLYITAVTNADTTSVDLVQTSQPDPAALENADYNNVTFVSLGTKTIASITTSAYNSISITDLTKISKTGVTLIGAVIKRDLDNVAPTGENKITHNTSDNASNKPYYDITIQAVANKSYAFFM